MLTDSCLARPQALAECQLSNSAAVDRISALQLAAEAEHAQRVAALEAQHAQHAQQYVEHCTALQEVCSNPETHNSKTLTLNAYSCKP